MIKHFSLLKTGGLMGATAGAVGNTTLTGSRRSIGSKIVDFKRMAHLSAF
jgi:hypothetical protein